MQEFSMAPPKAAPLPLLQRLRHVPLAALTEIYTDYLCAQKGLVAAFGPTLPRWATHQVGGYLGYSGRGANGAWKAAPFT